MKIDRDSENFMDTYGIKIVDMKDDNVRLEMEMREDFDNTLGYIHGAFIFLLADTAAGVMCISLGEPCVTMANSFNFMKASRDKYLYTATRLLHKGRSSTVLEVEVYGSDRDELIAKGIFTMFPTKKG